MHKAIVKSIVQEGDTLVVTADLLGGDGAPLRSPGIRNPIADEVARQLGNELPPDPDDIPLTDIALHVPVDALASRMLLYELKTPHEAFEAIMREHVRLGADDLHTPETRDHAVSVMADEKNVIEVDVQCRSKLTKIVGDNMDRLKAAYQARLPVEEGGEDVVDESR